MQLYLGDEAHGRDGHDGVAQRRHEEKCIYSIIFNYSTQLIASNCSTASYTVLTPLRHRSHDTERCGPKEG